MIVGCKGAAPREIRLPLICQPSTALDCAIAFGSSLGAFMYFPLFNRRCKDLVSGTQSFDLMIIFLQNQEKGQGKRGLVFKYE